MSVVVPPSRESASVPGPDPGIAEAAPLVRESSPRTGRIGRAFGLAAGLLFPLAWWANYTEIVSWGTDMIGTALAAPAVFALLLLVVGNRLLLRHAPRHAFTLAELATVFALLAIGLAIVGSGMMQFLVTNLAAVRWKAAGGGWEDALQHLPPWLTPDPAADRPVNLGGPLDWRLWARPIAAWSLFILALGGTLLCVMTLFRRPWIERERLTFPVVYLPLEMARAGVGASLLSGPLFWSAFALALGVETLNSVNYLYPSVPALPIKPTDMGGYFTEPPWNAIGYFPIAFYSMVLGLNWFLATEVLFSYWFFYLLAKAQEIAATAWGFRDPGAAAAMARMPYLNEQGFGAFMGIALTSFWLARRSILVTLRQALRGGGRSDEPAPHLLLALLALFAGCLIVFALLVGMPLWLAVAYFTLYLFIAVSIARMRAEAGTAWMFGANVNAHQAILKSTGGAGIGARGMTAFFAFEWHDLSYTTVAAPYQVEGYKLTDGARVTARAFFWAAMGITAVGIAAGWLSLLPIYHGAGVSTAHAEGWRTGEGVRSWVALQRWLTSPDKIDWTGLQAMAVGLLASLGLGAGRARFAWWPFHPAGYAIANTWTPHWLWFPAFLTWVVKSAVIRYGGIALYRRLMPFALGLVLGDFVAGCLWAILGAVLQINIYRTFVI